MCTKSLFGCSENELSSVITNFLPSLEPFEKNRKRKEASMLYIYVHYVQLL